MQTTAFLGVAHSHAIDFTARLNRRDDVRVKYVQDHDRERAQRYAGPLGAGVADLDTVLADPQVTSVIICSESRHHRYLAERAALAGKHLFVEKPLAMTGEEADEMVRVIEDAGVLFQTGFFMRSSPQNRFLRQEVQAGHLGRITRMRYTNCHQGVLARWFDTDSLWVTDAAEAGGGAFADLGAHALDVLLWVLASVCGSVVQVAAVLGNATQTYSSLDEWGAGLVTFENGACGILEASWVDAKLRSPVEVHGTRGEIMIRDGKVFYYSELVEGADGSEWIQLPAPLPHAFDLFLDKLSGQDVPLVPVREAAEQSRVMHRLYQAAADLKMGSAKHE